MLRSPASTQISNKWKLFQLVQSTKPYVVNKFWINFEKNNTCNKWLSTSSDSSFTIIIDQNQTQQSVPVAAISVSSQRQLPNIAHAKKISQHYTVQSSDLDDMTGKFSDNKQSCCNLKYIDRNRNEQKWKCGSTYELMMSSIDTCWHIHFAQVQIIMYIHVCIHVKHAYMYIVYFVPNVHV